MTDQADPRPLTPAARAHQDETEGYPVRLADGQTWKLAYAFHVGFLDEHRDRIADAVYTTGIPDPADVLYSTYCTLRLNYDVTPEEAYELVAPADPADRRKVFEATVVCLMGPDPEKMRRTYSEWVRSALLANGLSPRNIPAADLPGVLFHLEATGRIVPPTEFLSAARAATRRARLLRGE